MDERVTGTPEGHLLQDMNRQLFNWFASKPDARLRVREAVCAIHRNSLDCLQGVNYEYPSTQPPTQEVESAHGR